MTHGSRHAQALLAWALLVSLFGGCASLGLESPDSLITREVDDSTGYVATPFCPQKLHRWEWFYPGTEPTQECPVHRVLGPAFTP